ncbi:hypothetical protein FE783_08105 [Paenibacillus mesophilus]|nr:hypothetical protein FE783_08105 [Paenibacillus mesophilus]
MEADSMSNRFKCDFTNNRKFTPTPPISALLCVIVLVQLIIPGMFGTDRGRANAEAQLASVAQSVYGSVYSISPSGNGRGLRAEYYNGNQFAGQEVVRIDETIDFNWGNGNPAPGIGGDFTVRWNGKLTPRYTETYTLHTESHGGVRLWVDGQLLIDRWTAHNNITEDATVSLTAGQAHTIRMEYVEDNGAARARLLWSSASQAKEVIPKSQLNPPFIPGVPGNVGTTAASNSITLSWDPVPGAAGYDVEADGVVADNGANTTFVHAVSPNTQHTYRIRAKVPEIAGDWSAPVTATSKIAVPANLRATAANNAITVAWDAVAGASSYELEVDGLATDVGTNTVYVHGGLMPNTEHTYRIRAKSGSVASDWSAAITKLFLSDIPANLKAVSTSRSIALSWDEVIGAVGYEVEADGRILDNGAAVTFLHDGLEPNTRHSYRVRARMSDGVRGWSGILQKSTLSETGRGTGLKGVYFAQESLASPRHSRIDGVVDFDWGHGAPAPGVGGDSFSVRWTGQVEPTFSETYTFYTSAHGGTRLWINDSLLIDNWGAHDRNERSGSIRLEAGKRYDIQLEYRETNGVSAIQLLWESVSQAKDVIPRNQLYPVGVPQQLTSQSTETSISLGWAAVRFADSYEVEKDGVIVDAGNGVSYVHSDLAPGTLHTYRVRAKSGIVTGEWSETLPAATLLGTSTITEMSPTETTIGVAWLPVPGATSYEIETDGVIRNNNGDTFYMHEPLQPGTEHSYRVRAKTQAVTGEWTPISRKWTLPGIPQHVRTRTSSNSITVEWEAVTGATGYDLDVYNTIVDNGNSTQYTDNLLNPNTQHTYRIRAKNSSGFGKWTSIAADSTLPGVPGNLKVVAQDTEITLSWDASAGATMYEIEADGVPIGDAAKPSYVHTGLVPNTTHTYRVKAKNAEGATEWSSPITAITLPSIPGLLRADVSASAIVLNWEGVTGATGYDIEADGVVLASGIITSYTHGELNPNTEHAYRVRAKNGAVAGHWGERLIRKTLPPIPANVQAVSTSNEIVVSWEPVIGAVAYEMEADGTLVDNGLNTVFTHGGLAPFTTHTYKVRARSDAGAGEWSAAVSKSTGLDKPSVTTGEVTTSSILVSWNAVQGASGYDLMADGEITDVGVAVQYRHTGLSPYTWHAYRVRAKNGSAVGDWSDAVTKATSLAAPRILRMEATSSQIAVEWEEVAGATGYAIEADGAIRDNGSETIFLHTGLSSNSSHTYRVRALNGNGVSEWSESSEWSTLATQATAPEIPRSLTAEAATDSITLRWEAAAGSRSYELDIDGRTVAGITGTSYVHQGLTPNTMHTYRIRALNSGGASGWSGQLEQRTTPELTVNVGQDTMFNFVVMAPKKPDALERKITVVYNPEELEVLDLSASTPETELAAGPIRGTNISVSEFSNGRIVYTVSNADKTTVNIIKFMSKTNEYSKITYTVE